MYKRLLMNMFRNVQDKSCKPQLEEYTQKSIESNKY